MQQPRTAPAPPPPADHVTRPRPAGARLRRAAFVLGLGLALFAAGSVLLAPTGATGDRDDAAPATTGPQRTARAEAALQERLRRLPQDYAGWAELGMGHVQRGRTSADPADYAKAEAALRRSLRVRAEDNFQAETGMGALAAARHDFRTALRWGRAAAASNPANSGAQAVLADAYTQLGRYPESYRAVQRMVDLRPDTGSLARASYTWELRGDVPRARALMRRALDDAASPADQGFARAHLAGLALDNGDARTALREAGAGLAALPGDASLLDVRARARSALGDTRGALKDSKAAVAVTPLPQYLLSLGELYESLGQDARAREQYAVLRAQEKLRRATGSTPPDSDAVLFEADHGDPRQAVTLGRAAVRNRPFLAVQDAYAWALHRAGRDKEALVQADHSLALGTRSALYRYHRGLIHQALGDREAARADLRTALALEPHFSPLHAPAARAALQRIDSAS